jgi:hypothetical protein
MCKLPYRPSQGLLSVSRSARRRNDVRNLTQGKACLVIGKNDVSSLNANAIPLITLILLLRLIKHRGKALREKYVDDTIDVAVVSLDFLF